MPLMKAAKIGERFDLAITSSKGMSVTAARELIDHVCGKLGLPLYLLRDFDIAGLFHRQDADGVEPPLLVPASHQHDCRYRAQARRR